MGIRKPRYSFLLAGMAFLLAGALLIYRGYKYWGYSSLVLALFFFVTGSGMAYYLASSLSALSVVSGVVGRISRLFSKKK